MDLATIIGIILSTVLVLAAIVTGGSPVVFINLPSILIVLGGTFGATLMRNPLSQVIGTVKVAGKAFVTKAPPAGSLIDEVVAMSKKARKESLLALEKVEIAYPFLAKGVGLCVDGLEPAQVRAILETDIVATGSRHKRGQEILEGIGGAAPAFGMIGTLIGLVQMLQAMDDPASIGPAMAVALLTTLYGAMIANIVALPLADKLKVKSQEEQLAMVVCLEGVVGIVQGDHPASIGERLQAYLAPSARPAKEAA